MNLYLRYFEQEVFVHTADEAINFLASIPEIGMDAEMENDIREYVNSNVVYPKRYKVKPKVYFIIIKTEANTMEDFKEKKAIRSSSNDTGNVNAIAQLNKIRPGWYEGTLTFKRVILDPGTGKYQYVDTTFIADCKADCGQECYDRIVDYLSDLVDKRSQFPAAKGKNFNFRYLGTFK